LLERAEPPLDEIRELIELGYASKRKAAREAAAVIDTWLGRQPFDLEILRWHLPQQTEEAIK
jgi:hypothetical protein